MRLVDAIWSIGGAIKADAALVHDPNRPPCWRDAAGLVHVVNYPEKVYDPSCLGTLCHLPVTSSPASREAATCLSCLSVSGEPPR